MSRKDTRHLGRIKAFQVLYGLDFEPPLSEGQLAVRYTKCPDPRTEPAEADVQTGPGTPSGFAWDLVLGVWQTRSELDKLIESHSNHWKIERIARIELTILRLALYEMLHRPDIPVKVAINEAVELAKQFGDDNSRGFVNGILDAAAKALDHGAPGLD